MPDERQGDACRGATTDTPNLIILCNTIMYNMILCNMIL